jgi:predicted RNA-binding protein YlqC (UPF0109 family)
VTTDYTGLVEFIVKNIVENPDAVEVDGNSRRHRSQTVEVRLDPTDVGRVIGKGGKNIEAIRAVVKAAAIKDHTRVNVEVITEDDLRAEDGYDEGSEADEAPDAGEVMSEGTAPEAVAEVTDASTEPAEGLEDGTDGEAPATTPEPAAAPTGDYPVTTGGTSEQ